MPKKKTTQDENCPHCDIISLHMEFSDRGRELMREGDSRGAGNMFAVSSLLLGAAAICEDKLPEALDSLQRAAEIMYLNTPEVPEEHKCSSCPAGDICPDSTVVDTPGHPDNKPN